MVISRVGRILFLNDISGSASILDGREGSDQSCEGTGSPEVRPAA